MQLTNGTTSTPSSNSPAVRRKNDRLSRNEGEPSTPTTDDLVVGTHFESCALQSEADEVLIFETAESARQYSSARVSVRHMRPDETTKIPAHIPSRSDEEAGRDGAALDSSFSRKAVHSKYEQYRRLIERKIDGADVVRLCISSGGGTGTGTEDFFRRILREIPFDGRIIAIHHISPNVRRRKMTMALKGLLFEETSGNEIFDVLVRSEDHIQEVQQIRAETWAEIEALIANFHGTEGFTDLDLRQVRSLQVDHDRLIDDVTFDVVARSAPNRLKEGDHSRTENEREKHYREAQTCLENILDFAWPLEPGVVEGGIEEAAEKGNNALKSAIEDEVDALFEHDLDRVDELLAQLEEHVQVVGTKRLGVEDTLEEIRSVRNDLGESLSQIDQNELVKRLSTSRSKLNRVWVFGGESDDPLHEVKEYITYRHAHRVGGYIAEWMSENLLPPNSAFQKGFESQREQGYRLPDDSDLRPRLVDTYFSAETHRGGVENVRRQVEKLLPKLFNEIFRDRLHDELELDFATRHSERAKGAVVRSPFANEIDLRALDLAEPHVARVPRTEDEATTILQFKVSKRVANLPALRDMVQTVEGRAKEREDRRPYLKTAAEIWPLPLFEVPGGADPETARLLVAKAYATSDALRAESDCIRIRGVNEAKRYTDFKEFRERLTPRQANHLHREFWNDEFANDRGGCVSRIGSLADGEVREGQPAQRFQRLKEFVGATNWKETLSELHRRVKIAAEYWE